jgi:hypothetical protein
MTARRARRVDETTVIDLVMKGDYAGLAQLTGFTVDQIERTFDGMDDGYDTLDEDEDDDRFFDERDDDIFDDRDDEDPVPDD